MGGQEHLYPRRLAFVLSLEEDLMYVLGLS